MRESGGENGPERRVAALGGGDDEFSGAARAAPIHARSAAATVRSTRRGTGDPVPPHTDGVQRTENVKKSENGPKMEHRNGGKEKK